MTLVQIISNPAAGNHNANVVTALSQAFANNGAQTVSTIAGPDNPVALDDHADVICVIGGDGSIRHVAKAVSDSRRPVALAAWPGGTINLFQREVAKAKTPEAFARETLTATHAATHFGAYAGESFFLGCLSIGPDSHAVAHVSLRLKKTLGRFAYGVALMKLLRHWPRSAMRLTIDGTVHNCEAVYIANGTYFAGPWSFAPAARRTEPHFHIVALKRAGRMNYLSFMMRVVLGRPMTGKNYIVAKTAYCHIDAEAPCPVQIDGDVEGNLPMTVRISERPLAIV